MVIHLFSRQAVAAALTVWVAFFLMASVAYGRRAHTFEKNDCAACHSDGTNEKNWAVTPPEEYISSQCVNCHNSCDKWSNHENIHISPSGMKTALPLTGDGIVVCVTCHDPHVEVDTPEGRKHMGELRISNLRRELCLNCHHATGFVGAEVTVSLPRDRVVVYDNYVPLMGRARYLTESYVEVSINGDSFRLRVQDEIFHTRLKVYEGINRITVTHDDRVLWQGEVFRAEPEKKGGSYDRVYYNHQTKSLQECLECHRGDEGYFTAGTDPTPELCYRCHEPLDQKKFLHGPLAVGECNSCHDPHGGVGPFHLRTNEIALCLSCHGNEGLQDHRGWEEAVASGSCSSCHDPHQSDTRFLTREARIEIIP